ncbi:MAG TPA: 16S rRNA (guanine(527)-N(7))-methyltransferase RsmG, partial [Steroidobacteraceae bacterium]
MGGDALKARLLAGAQEMGVALDGAQAEAMLRLTAELREWNRRINLTAITGPADMVDKHLLDSLSVQPHLHGRRVADIGTGAGFPGVPLAIVNPRRSFTLIEATGKKCLFVRHAVELLGIDNVEVIQARAESWKPKALFDCVIARALGKL